MPRNLAAALLLVLALATARADAQGTPIGFAEDWALATDRSKVLALLIPGTEEAYYYQCRHLQDTGAFVQVQPVLDAWLQRHGRTQRVVEIENRQALLTFAADPQKTYEFLRQRLGLRFDHQREVGGEQRDLPTSLDPQLVSPAAFARRALEQHQNTVQGFRDAALEALLAGELNDDLLMSLLARLVRPDVANLPAAVVRNLGDRRSRGFGSLGIHGKLLREQLDECVRLRPTLLNESQFVAVYLQRLLPGADVVWQRDAVAREAYLDRLHAFAERLAPAYNSLKAHVLFHRLRHDLEAGKPDQERFRAYLRLPRSTSYANPDWLVRHQRAGHAVDLGHGYPTGLEPIRDDEPLVRQYFTHFFTKQDSWQPYAETVRADYLQRLFAETKILIGEGDMERWYSLLDDPQYYERLKERVEIEFAPTQRRYYGAAEQVTLEVDVKNVRKLLVKVFEVHTFNYYRTLDREVDASINLDGLVANEEMTREYDEGPLRRVRRTFDLQSLAKPGVYVVELIGNGLSSRAVVHKGMLQHTGRLGAAGHVLTVRDEAGNPLREASVWFGGKEYPADKQGEVVLPYSTDPGSRALILQHDRIATLARFYHRSEAYELSAGIHVDRESLISRRKARVLVRPTLQLNGLPISLEVLEDAVLTIRSRDLDGVDSHVEVRDLKLSAEQDLVHEVQVPAGLVVLAVSLRGRVQSLTQGKKIDLGTAEQSFPLNQIDATEKIACPLLGRTPQGYVLDVLGKNGEPKASRAVRLSFVHEHYTDPFTTTLKTDAAGRIRLGQLAGILAVLADGLPDTAQGWVLRDADRNWPSVLHGVEGETLRVPYVGRAQETSRSALSLLELRNGTFARDAFDHLALAGGFVELRNLPAGDYSLLLEEVGHEIHVRITKGRPSAGWMVGGHRLLEIDRRAPLHVTGVATEGGNLRVQLANAGKDVRVHVVATRYLAAFDPFAGFRAPALPAPAVELVDQPESTYHSGREIGDEYRYILDRRFAKKYPGNMLGRPGLLLSPWAIDEAAPNTSVGLGGGAGGKWGGRRGGANPGPGSPGPAPGGYGGQSPGTFANLEFLPEPATVLANLRADATGVVRVPLDTLGNGQLVHVLAVDDDDTVYASLTREETKLAPRSQKLTKALPQAKHLSETRRIEFVPAGGEAVLDDVATARAETYDSLAAVYRLFATLSGDDALAEFAFVLKWPELGAAEKRAAYDKHACHELHFFLQQKDPAFFREVVRPHLANKLHQTFLDRWLLDADLTPYLDPWTFQRLNIVERILLARRLSARSASVQRHVQELFELVPEDPQKLARLFDTALKSGTLEGGKGVAGKLAELREELEKDQEKTRAPAPGAPARPEKKSKDGKNEERARRAADKAAAEEGEESAEADDAPAEEAVPAPTLAPPEADAVEDRRADLERRKSVRELYRAPDATRPFVESNYWRVRTAQADASLIDANAFWRDFANAPVDEPFFSTNLAEATGSFAEMMFALAVLDLPFAAAEHVSKVDGSRLTLQAKSPLLLVRKELVPVERGDGASPILVSQNYYRLDEPYRFAGNERFDAFVTGEFLVDVAYGCRVVVTNPSSSPRKLELLLQIPEGAIPVKGGFYTKGVRLALDSYATQSIDYAFYFPGAGDAPHYPVHVAREGKLVAFAEPSTLRVVPEPSEIDKTSWQYLSQNGTAEQVLAYLEGANVQRTDLAKIAWRMQDKAFFAEVVGRLRQRYVYTDVLWSYAIRHGEVGAAREYLRHQDGFLAQCGMALGSELVTIDPVERHTYEQIEYEPLFNARAHRLGKQWRLGNHHLAAQYGRFLAVLGDRPQLDDADWMSSTYYLLLQDRVEDAMQCFARVRPEKLPMRVQYDYMRAYLDFFSAEVAVARGIAERYRDYPVLRWQKLFRDVLDQIDEAQGKATARGNEEDRTKRQTELAAAEPALDLEVEAQKVTLTWRNLESCDVRSYQMDVEFLFSTQPFVQQGAGSFAFIRPNRTEVRNLPKGKNALTFDLPQELRNANVLIEVHAAGITRRKAYFANSLDVTWSESYGQVKVAHQRNGQPLRQVYVKVFARMQDGNVRFYKDGYTDLRGRYDYASLSASDTPQVARYAVLVLSDEHGAVIREAAPPAQ